MNNEMNPSPFFRAFVPLQAVGASLIYFDIWNPTGSGVELWVHHVVPIVSGATAVTGVVGVDLHLNFTSAIGTGGTAATRGGTSLTAMTFARMSGRGGVVPGSISGRLTPTGGATAGEVISWASVFTEETNAGTYFGHTNDLVKRGYRDVPYVLIPENKGMSIVQGAVASVGNIGFDVIFQAPARR